MKRKKQEEERSHGGAPDDFCEWWYPNRTDEITGAAVGGHPDARRVWARRDGGHWTRRTYGTTANTAWQCAIYRDEYREWIDNGRPPRRQEFVSNAATLQQQKEFWGSVKSKLALVAKPMPVEDKQPLPPNDEDDEAIPF